MKQLSCGLALIIASTALAALAAQSGMKPGQWEYTMKMEMPGMPMAMPPQVHRQCLTQAEIDKGEQYQSGNEQDECEIKNMKQTGTGASYDVRCKDGITGHYDFTTAAGTMTGKGVVNMQGQQMTTNFSAKRLGDCP